MTDKAVKVIRNICSAVGAVTILLSVSTAAGYFVAGHLWLTLEGYCVLTLAALIIYGLRYFGRIAEVQLDQRRNIKHEKLLTYKRQ